LGLGYCIYVDFALAFVSKAHVYLEFFQIKVFFRKLC